MSISRSVALAATATLIATCSLAQSKFDVAFYGMAARNESDYVSGSGSLTYHANKCLDVIGRFTSTRVVNFPEPGFTLRDGGSDAELMLKFRPSGLKKLDIGIGASLPNTFDRSYSVVGTYDLGWTEKDKSANSLRFGLKGIAASNPITLATVAASVPTNYKGTDLIAEFGYPVGGDNTRSVNDGNPSRSLIGTVGVRFNSSPEEARYYAQLAMSNALGLTTGTSLTPAIGQRFGVSVLVGMKF